MGTASRSSSSDAKSTPEMSRRTAGIRLSPPLAKAATALMGPAGRQNIRQIPNLLINNNLSKLLPESKLRDSPQTKTRALVRGYFAVDFRGAGTLAPSRRASARPMAMACLRLFTRLPERPLRNVPALRSCIARSTFCAARGPYFVAMTSRISPRHCRRCLPDTASSGRRFPMDD